MKSCKYIVIENEHIYLFPMHIIHQDMYRNVKQCHLGRGESGSWGCTGAGFVRFNIEDDKVVGECYGESVSMDVASRPDIDNLLLERLVSNEW